MADKPPPMTPKVAAIVAQVKKRVADGKEYHRDPAAWCRRELARRRGKQ